MKNAEPFAQLALVTYASATAERIRCSVNAAQGNLAAFVAVAGEIARLIGLLDDDSTEIAEDAKAELISIGHKVVEPLSATVGTLDRYGQLYTSRWE